VSICQCRRCHRLPSDYQRDVRKRVKRVVFVQMTCRKHTRILPLDTLLFFNNDRINALFNNTERGPIYSEHTHTHTHAINNADELPSYIIRFFSFCNTNFFHSRLRFFFLFFCSQLLYNFRSLSLSSLFYRW